MARQEASPALWINRSWWPVVLNLLAGSLLGAWVGAHWATRLLTATLNHVLAVLLVFIAGVLVGSRLSVVPTQSLPPPVQVVASVLAGFSLGVVAALMRVAGRELLIPTITLPYGVDVKLAGSLSLAVSLPTCSSRSLATAATTAASSCAATPASSLTWLPAPPPAAFWAACWWVSSPRACSSRWGRRGRSGSTGEVGSRRRLTCEKDPRACSLKRGR